MPEPRWAMGPDAAASDRRTGGRMVADEVRYLTAKAGELLGEYDRLAPAQRLGTFEAVERLWQDVVVPALGDFETMQELWPGREPPPEDSVWHANAAVGRWPGGPARR
jgi:creatinine amidohydrolase